MSLSASEKACIDEAFRRLLRLSGAKEAFAGDFSLAAALTSDYAAPTPYTSTIAVGTVGPDSNDSASVFTNGTLYLQLANATYPGVMSAGQFTKLAGITGSNSGDISVAAPGASPNFNGMTLTGQQLKLEFANASNPGIISSATFSKIASIPSIGSVLAGTNAAGIQSILDGPYHRIELEEGTYSVANLAVAIEDTATNNSITAPYLEIIGKGSVTISVPSNPNAVGLTINKRRYVKIKNIRFVAAGSKADGNNVVGLKFSDNNSRFKVEECMFNGFSGVGLQMIQMLQGVVTDTQIQNCTWGISAEKDSGGTPSTSLYVRGGYIAGCDRGVYANQLAGGEISNVVFEECGRSDTNDAAIHFIGGTSCVSVNQNYFEANIRRFTFIDSPVTRKDNIYVNIASESAPVYTWSGFGATTRGQAELLSHKLSIRNLGPDVDGGFPLTIGSDIVCPVDGSGSTWGKLSTTAVSGTAVASTWGAMTTFGTGEMSGTTGGSGGATRAAYHYAVYLGLADLTQGFDMGTIINGTARSVTGTLPAWLRMNGSAFEINGQTGTSYGLRWKLTLFRMAPGTWP